MYDKSRKLLVLLKARTYMWVCQKSFNVLKGQIKIRYNKSEKNSGFGSGSCTETPLLCKP